MVCLETTFLIDLLRGNPKVKELKDEFDNYGLRITVASPTVMEIWAGAILSKRTPKEKEIIKSLLESIEVMHLDEESAKEAGEIEAELVSNGQIIQTEDIMIAAIARTNGEKLVTRDNHYARIEGLKLIKY